MKQVNTKTAYLFWILWIFGLGGVQRFYTGHFFLGLFYLLTFGGFGVGQLLDLALIPRMVERRNRDLAALPGYSASSFPKVTLSIGNIPENRDFVPEPEPQKSPMQRLIQAAKDQGGQLSIAQAVLYTEMEVDEVQELLMDAQRSGVAEVFNDPQTGAVRYRFDV